MGFDFVAQDETGAGVAGLGLVELVAERGEGLGAPGGGERVEPDEQLAGAGVDVAGGGDDLVDGRQGIGCCGPVRFIRRGGGAVTRAVRVRWRPSAA